MGPGLGRRRVVAGIDRLAVGLGELGITGCRLGFGGELGLHLRAHVDAAHAPRHVEDEQHDGDHHEEREHEPPDAGRDGVRVELLVGGEQVGSEREDRCGAAITSAGRGGGCGHDEHRTPLQGGFGPSRAVRLESSLDDPTRRRPR